ncbi:two-component sensor histidine kinase [Planktothrix agardhii CCAP 1459/11A]|uniref:histidine kinase n=1 Tax=Planktothrix agardhii CCAP 1459/11A TaxID=282420 RepID=A0A4P5ZD10_PLAAG|nr:ATP-binding protein [Planktothrix agardhii]GDZ93910.1 two-component sensor histidine kinase [Planktothrix agardhii CCAP 1459/11A]
MPKLGQSSFRRILLSQILLLSLPVLLVGEYVTYRKARSGLLETARLNLTESASKKAQTINEWIDFNKSGLTIATNNIVLQPEKPQQYSVLLSQLQEQFSPLVSCLQLTDLQTQKLIATTCGKKPIYSIPKNFWSSQKQQNPEIYINYLVPSLDQKNSEWRNQITLVFNSPIYVNQNNKNQLKYALSLQSTLYLESKEPPKSLTGFTVIIDQGGTIISHPSLNKLGQNIQDQADANRLKNLLSNALESKKNSFIHLFYFDQSGNELLAGYDSIPSPITSENDKQWVILAVVDLQQALSGLKDIKSLLISLVLSLVIASIIAAVYVSRDLAIPLEKLRDYALRAKNLDSPGDVPDNLRITEFNQLAEALNTMVASLRARAQALEYASKEAQVANQLKNEFLRVISHELRTPLNGIINSISLIQDGYCDTKTEEEEYLKIASDSSQHLLNLVDDILDIALIEEGKLSVMLEPTDLMQIVKDAVNLQMLDIQQKNLTLDLPTPDQPIIVQADPDKLKQVFINILNNSVKFTKSGGITISTRIELATNSLIEMQNNTASKSTTVRYQVVVTITDTGIGVALGHQQKIFEPFAMADGSTTREFGGIGLGLAISRRLMQMMGGFITLDSPGLDLGTTVMISIPLSDTNTKSPSTQSSISSHPVIAE